MQYTVEVSGVRKSYGGHVVLDGVDLCVPTGSVFALLGANGAGKTTLVHVLSTLVRPDGGHARIAGHDLATDPRGVRGEISLTGQYAAVDELLTAEENLHMMARLNRLSRTRARTRGRDLLAEFDLTAVRRKRVKYLSGGLRRRLDLAVSLIGRPRLVFLDEPTTGLDPRSREQVWECVRELAASGTSLFLTTQYLEEADRLADRVAMLDGGRVVAEGTADELKASLAGEVAVLEFADDAAYARALDLLAGEQVASRPERRTAEVATDGSVHKIRAVLATLDSGGAGVERLSLHRPSLDDVFLSLTQRSARAPTPQTTEVLR